MFHYFVCMYVSRFLLTCLIAVLLIADQSHLQQRVAILSVVTEDLPIFPSFSPTTFFSDASSALLLHLWDRWLILTHVLLLFDTGTIVLIKEISMLRIEPTRSTRRGESRGYPLRYSGCYTVVLGRPNFFAPPRELWNYCGCIRALFNVLICRSHDVVLLMLLPNVCHTARKKSLLKALWYSDGMNASEELPYMRDADRDRVISLTSYHSQAVMARRMGARVAMVGCLGEDSFGSSYLERLGDEGIDCSSMRRTRDVATGVAQICVEDAGGANFIVIVPGANYALSTADVALAVEKLNGARVMMVRERSRISHSGIVLAGVASLYRSTKNLLPSRRYLASSPPILV